MNASPEFTTRIIAAIPNATDPNKFLLDKNGQYPAMDYPGPGEQTYEKTFHRIGVEKLGVGTLSVAMRLVEIEGPHDIVYKAKPIAKDPSPDSGYSWKVRE